MGSRVCLGRAGRHFRRQWFDFGCISYGDKHKRIRETAKLQSDQNDDINDAHWFNYLNELAKEPDGVIISSNLAKALGLKVGDSLNYSR